MIRAILDFSIARRWLVVVLCVISAAAGGWAVTRLPIDAVPDITNNQVQINTRAPALSPLEVEKQVTFRIETALMGIAGLEYTRSLSRNGFSQVTAVFTDRTDIYFARQQINERLMELHGGLPPGAEPRIGPISTGLGEIYMWTVGFAADRGASKDTQRGWQQDGSYITPEGERLTSAVERGAYLRTVQDWIIRPQIRGVPSVAGVDSIGGYVKQYLVQPDPARLMALGLSFGDLAHAIETNNVSRGATVIERNGEGFAVRSGGRVEGLADLGEITVATRGGVPINLRDVAEIGIGAETRVGSASESGSEAVIGTALMLIGANSRTVAAAVDAKLRDVNRMLPPGIEAKAVLDRTALVNATIKTIATNLVEGALLVILVLFLLLGNLRAALITALVIPITMLVAAIGMVQLRLSANLMSLGALDFGLVVDGAVIIADNALRRLALAQREMGGALPVDERLACVRAAADEMIQPTVYGQAIIILVYVPLLTFSGVEGKMFAPMALTVILALVVAFVLSLTFVPAMIAILLNNSVQEHENPIMRWLKSLYAPVLRRVLYRPRLTVTVAVVIVGVAAVVYTRLGQVFIPTLDEKNVVVNAARIPGTALSQSQTMQSQLERAILGLPQVARVFSKTGTAEVASDPMPPNASDTFVILKPEEQWPNPSLGKEAFLEELERTVEALPGSSYEFSQPIQTRFNELLAGVRGDVAIKVFGDEFEPMLLAAGRIAAILRGTAGAVDVRVEQIAGLPVLEITPDRAEISRRGLSRAAVQDVIGAAIGGRDAGLLYQGDQYYDIVVRLSETLRGDVEALKKLPVPLPSAGGAHGGLTVPLGQVAQFRLTEGPNQISREDGKRRVVVTANVRGRDIASLVAEVRGRIEAEVTLPPGYWIGWAGQFENLAAARQRLLLVVPACFALIFLLLLAALGTPRDVLLVFSAVPLALTGGVAALWLRGMPISISAAIGFIAVSGIAVLNGLVLLTAIRGLIEEGRTKRRAIYEGAVTRLRPVVMTALVASLGFLPMAMATGTGAEVQKPLATVVIGGLASATFLTLLLLPALYVRFVTGAASRATRLGDRWSMSRKPQAVREPAMP
jgi:cobalt-zinc-cadmium resistance protein CzcA